MKEVDLNFIKYDRLFKSDLYRSIYLDSKKYIDVLPLSVELGDLYLINFTNYELLTKDEFRPNKKCGLGIVIGCKEYNLNNEIDNQYTRHLTIYFHKILFNELGVSSCIFTDFTKKSSYRYSFSYQQYFELTAVKSLKDESQKLINDYIEKNNVLNFLVPNEEILNQIYVKEDNVKVQF